MDYKANSDKVREVSKEPVQEKKTQKVITGTAKSKKKNAFLDVFIAEDIHDVKTFIISDVLVPAVKKLIWDVVTNATGMVLGENIKPKVGSGGKVPYRDYYDRADKKKEYPRRESSIRYSYDEQIVDSKGEAEEVLDEMEEILAKYGLVTVSTFYELLGKTGEHTDNKYGWTSLRSADAVRLRTGEYLLKLPKPMPLD